MGDKISVEVFELGISQIRNNFWRAARIDPVRVFSGNNALTFTSKRSGRVHTHFVENDTFVRQVFVLIVQLVVPTFLFERSLVLDALRMEHCV